MIKSSKGIIILKNKYLLQLRDNKKNIFFPNFWGLFGGSLNKNETHKKAVEREMNEETNLTVKAVKEVLCVHFSIKTLKKKYQIVYYECKNLKKKKFILSEGKKYSFFSFNQIKKLNMVPMDFVAISSHYFNDKNYPSKNC
jgi:8-oxo-dGTP diphosphatase|tara:strand:+ start:40 stop:462 length:423 start_codon:yes stop_codon:yes gene_type:complete